MPVKIALRLEGIDLREADWYLRIPDELAEVGFQAKGPISYAVVYGDGAGAAQEAADWAKRVMKLMPGVRVVGVYDELLGTSQIAARCAVAPEAVRLWASGRRRSRIRPFPTPREVIQQGASKKLAPLFAWSEVLEWVREVLGQDPEEGVCYLSVAQQADLNAELLSLEPVASNPHRPGPSWHVMTLPAAHAESGTTSSGPSLSSPERVVSLLLGRIQDALRDPMSTDVDVRRRQALRR